MYVKIPPGPSNFQSNEKSHHAKHGSCRTYVAVVVFIYLVPTVFVIVLNQLSSTLDMFGDSIPMGKVYNELPQTFPHMET